MELVSQNPRRCGPRYEYSVGQLAGWMATSTSSPAPVLPTAVQPDFQSRLLTNITPNWRLPLAEFRLGGSSELTLTPWG